MPFSTLNLPAGNSPPEETTPLPQIVLGTHVKEIDRAVVAKRVYLNGDTSEPPESIWSYTYNATIGVAEIDFQVAKKKIDEVVESGWRLVIYVAGILNPNQQSAAGPRQAAGELMQEMGIDNATVVSVSNNMGPTPQ